MYDLLPEFIKKPVADFVNGLPDFSTTVFLIIGFAIWAYVCAKLSAYLKVRKNIKTGYSRKTFHFLIFTSVAFINAFWGFSGVCLFGILVTGFVFYALFKKESSGLYQALARESDSPNGALYIVLPYFSTLAGGLFLNYFYPDYAVLGYLICGVGDASGEVVGTMVGKHRYKVKLFNYHPSFKSIEGSFSIFLISFIVYVVFAYNQQVNINFLMLFYIFVSSLLITLTENISPKGFDNFTLQVAGVLLFKFLIL